MASFDIAVWQYAIGLFELIERQGIEPALLKKVHCVILGSSIRRYLNVFS